MTPSIIQTLHKSYKELDSIYIDYAKNHNLSISNFWILYSINQSTEPLTQAEEEAMKAFSEEQQNLYNQFIKQHFEQLSSAVNKIKK